MSATGKISANGRFDALDSLRGVAALAVALYHLKINSHILDLPLIQHAWLFVDFFFVLSGFVITHAYLKRIHSAASCTGFVVRRFGRVWPLHVAMLLAFIALELSKLLAGYHGVAVRHQAFSDPMYSVSSIPTNILLIHSLGIEHNLTWNDPSWSISTEFWTYVLFALVAYATHAIPRISIGVSVILVFLGAIVVLLFSPHYMNATYDFGFFRCIYGFFIGSLLYRLHARHAFRFFAPAWGEVAAAVLALAFVWMAGEDLLSVAAPLVFAATIYVFAVEEGPISEFLRTKALRNLGKTSYSIYMIHAFVIYILHAVLSRVVPPSAAAAAGGGADTWAVLGGKWGGDLVVLFEVLVIVVLSQVTFAVIEHPFRSRFNSYGKSIERIDVA